MIKVKAKYDGKVLIPEKPLDFPAGSELELTLSEPLAQPPLIELVKVLEAFPSDPDWPPDMAAQHDHYLYGTPKRP